jgi:hypothetical protein
VKTRTLSVYMEKDSNPATINRLGEQSGLLLKTYQAELTKNPHSEATKSSRSNLIALLHTIHQVYGASISLDITNTLGSIDLPPESDR